MEKGETLTLFLVFRSQMQLYINKIA
uniref:Uncharacterized protein n=1 Tax=Rhizophora mucronata TaxID=61149 RepID=A0A2P2PK21_RHIMU